MPSETAPLSQTYETRGLLRRVDGMGTVAEVTARLDSVVGTAVGTPVGTAAAPSAGSTEQLG